RIELAGDGLNRATLARRIATLEQHQQTLAADRDPARHRHQLGLHRLEHFLIMLALHRLGLPIRLRNPSGIPSALPGTSLWARCRARAELAGCSPVPAGGPATPQSRWPPTSRR